MQFTIVQYYVSYIYKNWKSQPTCFLMNIWTWHIYDIKNVLETKSASVQQIKDSGNSVKVKFWSTSFSSIDFKTWNLILFSHMKSSNIELSIFWSEIFMIALKIMKLKILFRIHTAPSKLNCFIVYQKKICSI